MDRKWFYVIGAVCTVIVIIGIFGFYSYFSYAALKESPTITQGIYGKVTLITGNCMPSVEPGSSCIKTPVSRTVCIREPASWNAVEHTYLENETPLVTTTESNAKGFYEVELSPGSYSVFVEDEGKEYCNLFSDEGACLVELGNGLMEYNIQINHATW
jgi:hypothetical protein